MSEPAKTISMSVARNRIVAPMVATTAASGSVSRVCGKRSARPPQTGASSSWTAAWIAVSVPIWASSRPKSR